MADAKKANINSVTKKYALVDRLTMHNGVLKQIEKKLDPVKAALRKIAEHYKTPEHTSVELFGVDCDVPTLVKFSKPTLPKMLEEQSGLLLVGLMGKEAAALTNEPKTVYVVKEEAMETYLKNLVAEIDAATDPKQKEVLLNRKTSLESLLPRTVSAPTVTTGKLEDKALAELVKKLSKAEPDDAALIIETLAEIEKAVQEAQKLLAETVPAMPPKGAKKAPAKDKSPKRAVRA